MSLAAKRRAEATAELAAQQPEPSALVEAVLSGRKELRERIVQEWGECCQGGDPACHGPGGCLLIQAMNRPEAQAVAAAQQPEPPAAGELGEMTDRDVLETLKRLGVEQSLASDPEVCAHDNRRRLREADARNSRWRHECATPAPAPAGMETRDDGGHATDPEELAGSAAFREHLAEVDRAVRDALDSQNPPPGWVTNTGVLVDAIMDRLRPLVASAPAEPSEVARLRAAIEWAMGGPGSDFRERREGEGAYWWRNELAERAGCRWEGGAYQWPGASAPAEVAGWEELERAVERGLCTCGASCSAMRRGGKIVGTCGVEGCEWCSTSYQHLDEHPLADGHSESDWDDPACPVRQRMAEVLAAIKPLWPPARLEAVRELADAATALADEIEQGDDCGDKITRQLSDALVRVREAVLALGLPAKKEEEHAD